MKKMYPIILSSILILVPSFTYAQQDANLTYLIDAVTQIGTLISQLIPVVIALGLLFFIWGLVQFILASGNEDAKEVGKRRMIWGIIALFVIVSVWGLVNLLGEISGIQFLSEITIPSVDFIQ